MITKGQAYPGASRAPKAPPAFDLQGHRGARALRPENSLPSFEAALDVGVTTLELDVHLSADGVVVVTHDPFLSRRVCRLTAAAPVGARDPAHPHSPVAVSGLTVEELRAYRCDLNPDPVAFPDQDAGPAPLAVDDYGIPTLEEVFEFVERYAASELKTEAQRRRAAGVRFNIETKRVAGHPEYIGDAFGGGKPGRLEREVIRLVRQHSLVDRVTVQSFDHRSIRVIPQMEPRIRLAALTGDERVDLERLETATAARVWSPRHDALTAERLAAARAVGLLVIPWTVNDRVAMIRLLEMGVDGVITDFPHVAAGLLLERGVDF